METEKTNSPTESFKEKITQSLKDNLLFSIISLLWQNHLANNNLTDLEKNNFTKNFIKSWKNNIINITQEQLKNLNESFNDENIDLINIISGKNIAPDIEDYQKIINECITEIEKIYWQLSEK